MGTEGDLDLLRQLTRRGTLVGGERRTGEFVGTKALMLAVLEEGLRNYCGPHGRLRTDAESWVRSNRRSAFSFTMICETLGLEPDAVRAALPRLQNYATARPRRARPNGRRS